MPAINPRVDYDRIAPLYDEPSRDYRADPFLQRFLDAKNQGLTVAYSVMDIGCGTGKQLAANHLVHPGLHLVGLDLFRGMLKQAQERSRTVGWVQADCTRAPIASESFDFVTSQFSYHHVKNKPAMLAQAFRLLRPGGRFVITNLDPWAMEDWIVYQFFPASRRRDFEDFLPLKDLITLLEATGFHDVAMERQTSRSDEKLVTFLEYAQQRYRTSQLMVISDREYEQGLSRLEREISSRPFGAQVSSMISIVWISGDKPGGLEYSTESHAATG